MAYKNGQLVTINKHVFRVVTNNTQCATCTFCQDINGVQHLPCRIASQTLNSTFSCVFLNSNQTLKFVK